MTILEALEHPDLFGAMPAFRDLSTWRPWLVYLKAVYGLPMDAGEEELFRRHTGRSVYAPPAGGWREAVAIVGRQAGKSQVAAIVTAFEAALADASARGQHALLVAQDLRGAQRTLLNYCREIFEDVPTFHRELDHDTANTLELANGVSLSVYPCRPAAVRGVRARVAVVDELAYFIATDGRPTDVEMLRAVRPSLAMTGGKLLILSSPYSQAGALWDLYRRHHGRDDSRILVWNATAPEMNERLGADYLETMEAEDPEAFRSEVLGEFRAGLSTLFDSDALQACVVPERRELPPVADVSYRAFVDPSGGVRDAFTLAIGHREKARAVVDVLRTWRAPFNPAGVVAEAVADLKRYRLGRVTGDRYAGEWPREAFRAHEVMYEPSELERSALYLQLLPVVMGAGVELLDHPDLLRELRGLERRRGSAGRDRVDHRPGAHDDRANAVAGLLSLLRRPTESCSVVLPPSDGRLNGMRLRADYERLRSGRRGLFV